MASHFTDRHRVEWFLHGQASSWGSNPGLSNARAQSLALWLLQAASILLLLLEAEGGPDICHWAGPPCDLTSGVCAHLFSELPDLGALTGAHKKRETQLQGSGRKAKDTFGAAAAEGLTPPPSACVHASIPSFGPHPTNLSPRAWWGGSAK